MILSVLVPAAGALEPPRTRAELPREEVIVDDPANPGGMQLRRARMPDEPWLVYFQDVLLWPYTDRHYNTFYAVLDQNGRRLQFVPNVIFEVDGEWILVVRGARDQVEAAVKHVRLDGLGRRFSVRPARSVILDDREDGAWVGFVWFTPPSPMPDPSPAGGTSDDALRVMSSFEQFQDAGGVAQVLDEHAVRQRYKVLRDIVDVLIDRVLRGTP